MSKSEDPFERQRSSYKQYKQHVEKETRRKKIKSAKKETKRRHRDSRTRRKNWIPDNLDDWEELDYDLEERIIPRGEGERRQALEKQMLQPSEPATSPDESAPAPPPAQGQRGLVVEVSKGLCRVEVGQETLLCHIRSALSARETGFTNVVAVGDEVIVSQDGAEGGVVEEVLPRRSVLARPDVFRSHLQQVIVANADQLLIVSSWREPALWPELIDRYLIAAARNRLPALICVNKMDLIEDSAECEATLQPYRALGYQIVLTSALTGQGIGHLHRLLQNRTTVLAGLSGVGKSSLLAAAQPELNLRTNAVSERSGEGRHTTTQATLLSLGNGTVVIDTPGIREFGLSGVQQQELAQFFPEIAALAPNCRFKNCAHIEEPDCAVQAAQAAGQIAASRYHSYKQIYAALE